MIKAFIYFTFVSQVSFTTYEYCGWMIDCASEVNLVINNDAGESEKNGGTKTTQNNFVLSEVNQGFKIKSSLVSQLLEENMRSLFNPLIHTPPPEKSINS